MDNASFEADSDKQFEPAQDRQLNKYYSELSPSFECNEVSCTCVPCQISIAMIQEWMSRNC